MLKGRTDESPVKKEALKNAPFLRSDSVGDDVKMRRKYSTVKVPIELSEKLDQLVKEMGYRSRADIVNDAIRRFIESRHIEMVNATLHNIQSKMQ